MNTFQPAGALFAQVVKGLEPKPEVAPAKDQQMAFEPGELAPPPARDPKAALKAGAMR